MSTGQKSSTIFQSCDKDSADGGNSSFANTNSAGSATASDCSNGSSSRVERSRDSNEERIADKSNIGAGESGKNSKVGWADEKNRDSGGMFVRDAVLHSLLFEDYSRASKWELLLHRLVSSIRSLPITAARHRFLAQVAAANTAAAAGAASAIACAPFSTKQRRTRSLSNLNSKRDENTYGSKHASAVIPPRCICFCSSQAEQQQHKNSTVSLQLFAPLVLQSILPDSEHKRIYHKDASQTAQQHGFRLTYFCSAPLPDFGCTCSRSNPLAKGAAASPVAMFAQRHDIPVSLSDPHLLSSGSVESKGLRCGTCAACVLSWERLFPSRASFVQRDFGGEFGPSSSWGGSLSLKLPVRDPGVVLSFSLSFRVSPP